MRLITPKMLFCSLLKSLFHHQINASHEEENLHHQANAVTSETRDSPRRKGKEVVDSVFVVEVDKSLGSLGLALEGGSDVGSDVRIKSIKVRLTFSTCYTIFQKLINNS